MNALTRCHANCGRGRLFGAAWSPVIGVDPVNGADDRGCRSRPHRGRLQGRGKVESAFISNFVCRTRIWRLHATKPAAQSDGWQAEVCRLPRMQAMRGKRQRVTTPVTADFTAGSPSAYDTKFDRGVFLWYTIKRVDVSYPAGRLP